MTTKKIRPARLVCAGALVLAMAGCGSPLGGGDDDKINSDAKAVYDEINGLTGQERTDRLVKLAEEDGELSVYTSNTDMDALTEAFTDKFGIEVTSYRGNSESVLQRITQEAEAGHHDVDYVDTNAAELSIMSSEGLLGDYEGELRDAVRPEGQMENWTANRFNLFVVGWNTDLVKDGDLPASLEDLADPRWKGKVSLELGDVDWYAAMVKYYQEQGMSDEGIADLFTKLADNSMTVKGHAMQGDLMSAGQFAIAPAIYSHTVDKAADKDAPVTWHKADGGVIEPVVTRPNGAAIMAGARHPAAAMLFMDFVLTDGQKFIADAFRVPAIPPDGKDPLEGLETVPVPVDELLADYEKWNEPYEDLVQGRETLGG